MIYLKSFHHGIAVGLSLHPRAPGRKQSPTRNLLERLRDRAADVLRFADDPLHVPFTNNTGERALRPVKTQIKISGCHQSETGAAAWLDVRSYLDSARKHGLGAPSRPSTVPSPATSGCRPSHNHLTSRPHTPSPISRIPSECVHKFRNDRWVFGAPGTPAYVTKFSWTDIVRHAMVKGKASPDDPSLTDYWATRRKKVKLPLDKYTLRLLTKQEARCPLCGDHLLFAEQPPESPEQWERWWLRIARQAITADYLVHHGRPGSRSNDDGTRLVHASCRRGYLIRQRRGTAQLP